MRPATSFTCALLLAGSVLVAPAAPKTVKVFLLAGQSNMEGQGVVDLDHPRYYNGGKGILVRVMADPFQAKLYAHLKDNGGKWVVRDDAFIRFRNKQGVMAGGVSIGFTGYGSDKSRHHIGPELQIGHVLGDHFKEPVLLIKTAWGGKSLFKDFRPPSAGGRGGRVLQEDAGRGERGSREHGEGVPLAQGTQSRMGRLHMVSGVERHVQQGCLSGV